MKADSTTSRVLPTVDFDRPGRQVGELLIRWSDNRRPLGAYGVPLVCLANGDGPTVLLTGGVHGDEFEGPAALMRLAQRLVPADLGGRLLVVPALNPQALAASSRVSPLDGLNLNRAFPGDPDGSPTQMVAHYVETVLLPQCDAVIDLHSGGCAARFAACVLADIRPGSPQARANLELATAFGAPWVWVSNAHNDDRSLNAAASRRGVTMIAAELGGGGGCDPAMTGFAEAALGRCLQRLGLLATPIESAPAAPRFVQTERAYLAPAAGLFDRGFALGDAVASGQRAGDLHFVDEPARPSLELNFPAAGFVLAHGDRGMVERGDLIALLATEIDIADRIR